MELLTRLAGWRQEGLRTLQHAQDSAAHTDEDDHQQDEEATEDQPVLRVSHSAQDQQFAEEKTERWRTDNVEKCQPENKSTPRHTLHQAVHRINFTGLEVAIDATSHEEEGDFAEGIK